jgi:hypothetical protein
MLLWVLMIHQWSDERLRNGLVLVRPLHTFHPRLMTPRQPLLTKFSAQHISSDGLPIYRRLQSDDQDSVRLLTIEDLIVIVQRMSPNDVKEQLLKPIRSSIGDKSWRVRYMGASHFNEVKYAIT